MNRDHKDVQHSLKETLKTQFFASFSFFSVKTMKNSLKEVKMCEKFKETVQKRIWPAFWCTLHPHTGRNRQH